MKKRMKNNLKKFGVVATMSAMALGLVACGGNNSEGKETEGSVAITEPTTQTDILAVEITDKDGNKHLIEGVGVTDESGKVTITVTDKEGNQTVIKGDAATDSEGNKTVTNATVEQGGTLTNNKGDKIDTTDATVGAVKDNNDGSNFTDVQLPGEIVGEVESKKEEASREQASKEQASREEAEKATQAPTIAPSELPTLPNTEHPTVKPTITETQTETSKPAETQAPTSKPAETQKPTETQKPAETESQVVTYGKTDWGADIISVSQTKYSYSYETADWRISVNKKDGGIWIGYYGTEKCPTIPTTFNGTLIEGVNFAGNDHIETIILPDTIKDVGGILSMSNLKSITFGKGFTALESCTIGYCYNLKEVIVKGTIASDGIDFSFIEGGSLGESFCHPDVIVFYQNPETIDIFKGKTDAERLEAINFRTHGENDFKSIKFIY